MKRGFALKTRACNLATASVAKTIVDLIQRGQRGDRNFTDDELELLTAFDVFVQARQRHGAFLRFLYRVKYPNLEAVVSEVCKMLGKRDALVTPGDAR